MLPSLVTTGLHGFSGSAIASCTNHKSQCILECFKFFSSLVASIANPYCLVLMKFIMHFYNTLWIKIEWTISWFKTDLKVLPIEWLNRSGLLPVTVSSCWKVVAKQRQLCIKSWVKSLIRCRPNNSLITPMKTGGILYKVLSYTCKICKCTNISNKGARRNPEVRPE